MKINLKNHKGFQWKKFDNIYFKGRIESNVSKVINRLKSINTLEEFSELVNKLNNSFSTVLETSDYYFIAVDPVRTFPLFYKSANNLITEVTDSIQFRNFNANSLNNQSINEFMHGGYVLGNKTLITNVYQLEAGDCLSINKKSFSIKFQNFHDRLSPIRINSNIDKLKDIHLDIFKDIIKYANGRQILIPLSGGYDSREIALNLKELGYENVSCFTFGSKHNWEVGISKSIADYLGYKWHFIPYSRKLWYQYYNSKLFWEYKNLAINAVSSTVEQEILALNFLRSNSFINSDTIVIPGHTGDYIQGGHIPNQKQRQELVDLDDVAEYLSRFHLNNWKHANSQEKTVSKLLEDNFVRRTDSFIEMIELFNLKERQAKYIVNAVRAYEYFDLEFALPFWDRRYIEFWKSIPISVKAERRMYFDYVQKFHPKELMKANPEISRLNYYRNRLTADWYGKLNGNEYLPFAIKAKIKKYVKNTTKIDNKYLKPYIYKTSQMALNSITHVDWIYSNMAR